MKPQPTAEQIAKLPQWAQAHIQDLARRASVAEKQVARAQDEQTPSPFYVDDLLCIGEGSPQTVRRYFDTHRMTLAFEGMELDISLPRGVQGREGIELHWERTDKPRQPVIMQPYSHQAIRLINPDFTDEDRQR